MNEVKEEQRVKLVEGDSVVWMGNQWEIETVNGTSYILVDPNDHTIHALAYWGELTLPNQVSS